MCVVFLLVKLWLKDKGDIFFTELGIYLYLIFPPCCKTRDLRCHADIFSVYPSKYTLVPENILDNIVSLPMLANLVLSNLILKHYGIL